MDLFIFNQLSNVSILVLAIVITSSVIMFLTNNDKTKILSFFTIIVLCCVLIADIIVNKVKAETDSTTIKDLETEISNLKLRNDSLLSINDSLDLQISKSEQKIKDLDKSVDKYKDISKKNKEKQNEKVTIIDNADSDDIDSMFSDYSSRYYELYIKP